MEWPGKYPLKEIPSAQSTLEDASHDPKHQKICENDQTKYENECDDGSFVHLW